MKNDDPYHKKELGQVYEAQQVDEISPNASVYIASHHHSYHSTFSAPSYAAYGCDEFSQASEASVDSVTVFTCPLSIRMDSEELSSEPGAPLTRQCNQLFYSENELYSHVSVSHPGALIDIPKK